MDMYRIVTDSSSDMKSMQLPLLRVAALKILTDEREYVDDELLDVRQMVQDLSAYKGRSSTSCPNSDDWLSAFGDARYVICVTITSGLSGAYNAAMVAKQMYEEQHPGRCVFVLDSLSTGPEMRLVTEEAHRLCQLELPFETVCASLKAYSKRCGLLFMLESMRNLANNGRVHPLVAKAAGLFDIRVVGCASEEGTLQPLGKCRGRANSLKRIASCLKEKLPRVTKVYISHCFNEEAAQALRSLLLCDLPQLAVKIYSCGGLCGFYAEKGGLLVGYETE